MVLPTQEFDVRTKSLGQLLSCHQSTPMVEWNLQRILKEVDYLDAFAGFGPRIASFMLIDDL